MKRIFILFTFTTFFGFTQISTPTWGVDDTICTITKTTDFGIVHDYIELFNYSGGDLNMRWIIDIPPTWPVEWDANFNDPSNNYPDVLIVDSADFLITDPIGWDNKLIIGVQHHSFAATSYLRFKVFPVDHPEDSLWLYYNIIINQGEAYFGLEETNEPTVNIQLMGSELRINSDLEELNYMSIYNLNGQLIYSQSLSGKSKEIGLSASWKGIYIIQVRTETGAIIKKKVNLN